MSIISDNIGDSVTMRARHTDGEGLFSEEYVIDSITTQEVPFVNLYVSSQDDALFDGGDLGYTYMHKNSIQELVYNTAETKELLKRWFPNYLEERNAAMAEYNGFMYRVVTVYDNNGNHHTEFQKVKINTDTVFIELVDLTHGSDALPEFPQAMAYINNDTFVLIGSNNYYKITISGDHFTCTNIANDGFFISGIVPTFNEVPIYYVTSEQDNSFKSFDPNDGSMSGTLQLTFASAPYSANYTIIYCSAMTQFDGRIIASVVATPTVDGDTAYFLVEINSNDATCDVLHTIPPQFSDLCPINRSETTELVGWTSNSTTELYKGAIYIINPTNVEGAEAIGDPFYRFENRFNDDSFKIAFNQLDGHLYHLSWRECMNCPYLENSEDHILYYLSLEKMNPYTLKIESVELSGFLPSDLVANYSIGDGGHDMYDDGNYLNTNFGSIPYTHTVQSSDMFVEIADGEVVDGANHFGAGSHYFTNLYAGLFVMAAYGIDITFFEINGELGADGDGEVVADVYHLTVGGRHFSVYYKSVADGRINGDPSVNHLIIVEGTGSGITHTYSNDTDFDNHKISGLSGISNIYYLLFSNHQESDSESPSGFHPTQEEVEAIATAFLTIVTSAADNADALLSALNSGVGSVESQITDSYLFSDFNSPETGQGLIGDITGFTHDPVTNKFYVLTNQDMICSITPSGLISPVRTHLSGPTPSFAVVSMMTIRQNLFAVDFFTNYLTNYSKIDGEFLNINQDIGKPYDVAVPSNEEFSVSSFRAIAEYGPTPIAIVNVGSNILATLDSRYKPYFVTYLIGTVYSEIYNLASELVPAQMQLLGITGDSESTNTYKTDSLFVVSNTGEILDGLPLKHNQIDQTLVTQAYTDGYLYRIYKSNEDGQVYTRFERLNTTTREFESLTSNSFHTTNPQAFIWIGDRFFYICDSDIYWLYKNGNYSSSVVNSTGLAFVGLAFINTDEVTRVLFGVTNTNYLVAFNENTGELIQNYFGIETTGLEITVAGWNVVEISSATMYSNQLYIIASLANHESLPDGWYRVTVDVSNGEGTVVRSEPGRLNALVNIGGPDVVYLYNYLDATVYNNQTYNGGQIYIETQDEVSISFLSKFCRASSYAQTFDGLAVATYNDKLYAVLRINDDLTNNAAVTTLRALSPHTGFSTIHTIVDDEIGTPLSMIYTNDKFYVYTETGFYSLTPSGDPTIPETSFSAGKLGETNNVTGMTIVGSTVFAVTYDDASFNTVNLADGTLTTLGNITVDGNSIAEFVTMTKLNGVLYAIFLDQESNPYLVTINSDTLVGTPIAQVPHLRGLVAAPAPVQTSAPIMSQWWWDNNNRISLRYEGDGEVNIQNMVAEFYPADVSRFDKVPEFGWKRMEIIGKHQEESGWIVDFDHQSVAGTVRVRYRNPNSAWSYGRYD